MNHIRYCLAIAATCLLLGAPAQAIGETVAWTEDVLLHDGRVITATLRASDTLEVRSPWPLRLYFNRSSLDRYSVEVVHPDNHQRIVWEGERNFIPMLIDFIRGVPYMVVSGRPDEKTKAIYGCPEMPFIYLRYASGEWKPVPTDEAPVELRHANLSAYQIYSGTEGRHLSQNEVLQDIQFSERQLGGYIQATIPRSYAEWQVKNKNSHRNDRRMGDCRPPPEPLPDIALPKPTDVPLELVSSSDVASRGGDEYYKVLAGKQGMVLRSKCKGVFRAADPDNLMLGERFVGDPTGNKRLPYTGPAPIPSHLMVGRRAERYCSDKFVWFIAAYEEARNTAITKFNMSGDLVYTVRIDKPTTADNKLGRSMVVDSITAEEGYFYFYWVQSLPQVAGRPHEYLSRISKFRFREPEQ